MAEAQEYTREPQVVKSSIFTANQALEKAPEIVGVPTGVEGLDELFFTVKEVDGELKQVPLGGIPRYSVMNITGVSDTGKSLMVEQFAVEQAHRGHAVAFITVESPANFVVASMRERAKAMGYKFEDLDDKIIFIDAASNSVLRENLPDLLATLAYVIKTYKVKFTIIDSVTGLYENKEMMARSIVRRIYNFLKKWYQTALLVSQKRSGHEELSAEAAGGFAVSHIVDGSMVLAKQLITTSYVAKIYKRPVGEVVRLFRIDGCRMSGHDSRTYVMDITPTGLVKIVCPLGQC